MIRCQPKDYNEKLQSLYNHTVPVIKCKDLIDDIKAGKEMFILDIRSKEEYSISHLEDARLVGEKLMAKGYKNVKNLYGGIFQWKNEGYEVVNEKSMETDSVHTYNRRWSKWLTNGIKVY